MERKIIAVAIVITALVLVVVLYGGQDERISDDEYVTLPSGDEILKAEYETFEDEYAGMPFEELNLQECEGVGELDRDVCISNAAREQKDAAICNGVENYDGRANCYWEVAAASGNAELCVNAGAGRDACYASLGVGQGSAELCAKAGEERDYCFYTIAVAGNNGTLCGNISPAPNRDNCYFRVAVATANVSLCKNMEYNMDNCIGEVAFNTGNSALCEGAAGPEECYASLEE